MKTTLLFALSVIAFPFFAQSQHLEPFTAEHILTEANLPPATPVPDDLRSDKLKLDSTYTKTYNQLDNTWHDGTQNKYAYYENGSIKSVHTKYPNVGIEISEFNEDRTLKSFTYQAWNGSEFENQFKTNFFHDAQGTKSDTSYAWDGSQWAYSGYSTFIYDVNGLLSQKLTFIKVTNQIIPAMKFIFHYNSDDLIEELHTFNYTNTFWEPSYIYHYTYNDQLQLKKFLYERWNAGVWVNQYREDYLYANNNMIELKSFSWDNNTWTHIILEERQYDNLTTTDAVWLPEDLRTNTHQITGKQTYLYQNGLYAYADSTLFFYKGSTVNSVADDMEEVDFQILGNPFHNELVISNEGATPSEIAVYSITGQQVYYGNHQEDIIRINLEAVKPGTYIIHYKNDKKHKVKKATKY